MRIVIREEGIEYRTRSEIPVRTPQQTVDAVKELKNLEQEAFAVLMLSARNNLISADIITLGIVNGSLVHPREVFRTAISKNASAIVLAHNHPSGDPSPSSEDMRITKQLIEAGKIIDIPVFDHVIIGTNFISMREEGLCSFPS